MKKGLAVISKIFLMVFILVVGFSSYTAYMYFAEPDFDFYGAGKYLGLEKSAEEQEVEEVEDRVDYASLLPDVHQYVDGANADMILVYRKNDQLVEMFGSIIDDQSVDFGLASSEIVAAVGAVIGPSEENDNDGAFIIAVEFESEERSMAFQEMADFMLLMTDGIEGETEVDGNIFIVKVFGGLFEGSVIDNPLMEKMEIEYADSEMIVLVDPMGVPEINSTILNMIQLNAMSASMESSLLVAHAQGLIGEEDQPAGSDGATTNAVGFEMFGEMREPSTFEKFVQSLGLMINFTEFEAFYFKVGDETLDMLMVMDFIDESDLAKIETGGATFTIEMYEEFSTSFSTSVDELKKENVEGNPDIEDFSIKFEGNRFMANISFPLPSGDIVAKKVGPQMRARDVGRMGDLNRIVVAVETYASDYGEYFEKSSCVSDLYALNPYFPNGEIPADFGGSATFESVGDGGDIFCEDGYFYQYFGNEGEYVVWAKMEVDDGGYGNQGEFVTDKSKIESIEGGKYYVISQARSDVSGEMFPYVGNDMVEDIEEDAPAKTGVSRGVPRS